MGVRGMAMSDRTGIFAGDDPFALAQDWMDLARGSEIADPDAVALASVDTSGLPNVRIVLLRSIEPDAFVFYTNYQSAKGQELIGSGKAAFVWHWKSLKRQIRVRGLVEKEDGEKADAYYHSRPLGSRIGAWASQQSQPLEAREDLVRAVEEATETYGDTPSRPPHWGGFRIRPLEMEFWADGEFRLHDRFRWTRDKVNEAWTIHRLNP